jgi:signal transduction histidine kinase
LLTNAVTFTKTGTIIVNAKVKENTGDGQVIVSVRDTGSGIDPEIAPRLFTKFASKSDSGTELGLYISKVLLRLMEEKSGLKITLMEEGQHSVLHYH